MLKKLVALLFLFQVGIHAQSPTPTIVWGQPETNAQSFVYTLKIDALAPVTLVATCANGSCSAPFTLTNPSAVHTYVFTSTNSFGSTVATLGPGALPNTSGVKIIVVVTISSSNNE